MTRSLVVGLVLLFVPVAGAKPQPASPLRLPVDATKVYRPLERVAGALRPRDPTADVNAGRFAEATAYAEMMDSSALLIWQGGLLRVERYWNGAVRESRPEPASMHKTVMGLLFGQAIADGSIPSLEDPVGRYVTEWESDARGQITLRQVLQMATGLEPLRREGDNSDATRFARGPDALRLLLAQRLSAAPGAKFEYQNSVSQLACVVIERATGRRYADYLSSRLWRPLGGGDAFVWLNEPGGSARCYSSLLARPVDWLRIGLLIKNGGRAEGRRVVPRRWIDAMVAPSATNPNYGMQIWMAAPFTPVRYYNQQRSGYSVHASAPVLAADMVFMDGFGGQRVYVSRQHDFVIVRLGQPRRDWDDTMLPNLVSRGARLDTIKR